MSDEQQPNNQINIELSEQIAEGTYANLAIVSYTPSEFVLDFVRAVPAVPKAHVKSRVILAPEHAMRLMRTLKNSLDRYEEQFGKIRLHDEQPNFPTHFSGTAGEA